MLYTSLFFVLSLGVISYLFYNSEKERRKLEAFIMKSLDAKTAIGIIDSPEVKVSKEEKRDREVQITFEKVLEEGVINKKQKATLKDFIRPLGYDDEGLR